MSDNPIPSVGTNFPSLSVANPNSADAPVLTALPVLDRNVLAYCELVRLGAAGVLPGCASQGPKAVIIGAYRVWPERIYDVQRA